jgi:hypothetical protein
VYRKGLVDLIWCVEGAMGMVEIFEWKEVGAIDYFLGYFQA